jgi:hypothetical protein
MINLLTILLAAFTHLLTRKKNESMTRIAGTSGKLRAAIVLSAAHALCTAGFLYPWKLFTGVHSSPPQEALVFWIFLFQDFLQYELLEVKWVPLLVSLASLACTGELGRILLDPKS